MLVDETRDGDEVELAPGDVLELSLTERPTSGFRWNLLSDPQPVLRLAGDAFEPPTGPHGASGTRTWRFEAAQPGSGVIQLAYRRAWEADADPARTFTLRVRVPSTSD